MEDIFIFDTDVDMSTSKYFRLKDHSAIITSLNTKQHRPEMGIKAYQWCQEIVDVRWHVLKENLINVLIFFFKDSPQDWIASLGFVGRVLCEAVKEEIS